MKKSIIVIITGVLIIGALITGLMLNYGSAQTLAMPTAKVVIVSPEVLPDSTVKIIDSIAIVRNQCVDQRKNLHDMVAIMEWQQRQIEEDQRKLDSFSSLSRY